MRYIDAREKYKRAGRSKTKRRSICMQYTRREDAYSADDLDGAGAFEERRVRATVNTLISNFVSHILISIRNISILAMTISPFKWQHRIAHLHHERMKGL